MYNVILNLSLLQETTIEGCVDNIGVAILADNLGAQLFANDVKRIITSKTSRAETESMLISSC